MKQRFRLYRRAGGIYYIHDGNTGKQESLHTRNRAEASALFAAKTQSHRQAHLNLRLARTYLAATDPMVSKRTWRVPIEELARTKRGTTNERWQRALKDKAFDLIRDLPILETQAEHFLKVLSIGTVSTNVFLRRAHNFALDMGWLPWPVILKRQWPAIEYAPKRAITLAEHQAILERERNLEWRTFYALLWHVGGSQSDVATMCAENIDWEQRVISYARGKTGAMSHLRFGKEAEALLRRLPSAGALFPKVALRHEKHRAKEFKRRCVGLGIKGVTLHSYRYSWAERARKAGYPERYAMENLGHNSKAAHWGYAKKAQVIVPSLEAYEERAEEARIIPMPLPQHLIVNPLSLALKQSV